MNLTHFLSNINKTNLIPFLIGKHGIGKTQRVKSFAVEHGYELVVIDCTTLKEGELTGLPLNINSTVEKQKILSAQELIAKVYSDLAGEEETPEEAEIDESTSNLILTEALIQLNSTLQKEEDEEGIVLTYSKYYKLNKVIKLLEEGKKVVLFLDEVNRVNKEVQTELMNFCQTKIINTVDLSKYGKSLMMVLAGNPTFGEFDYQTTEFNDAFKDRLAPIEMDEDYNGWMKWAIINDIDERIIIFLDSHSAFLHYWKAGESLRGATNRSWEELSHLIKGLDNRTIQEDYIGLVNSVIGSAAGSMFLASLSEMKPLFADKFLDGKGFDKSETAIRQKLSAMEAVKKVENHINEKVDDKKIDQLLINFTEVLANFCHKEVQTAVASDILNSDSKKQSMQLIKTKVFMKPEFAALKKTINEINTITTKTK